jgi:hypothetical protein
VKTARAPKEAMSDREKVHTRMWRSP